MKENPYNKPLRIAGVFLILFVLIDMLKNSFKSNHKMVLDTLAAAAVPSHLRLYILAQAMHESNNFRSALFLRAKNAFGYSYVPGNIYQAGKDGALRYAVYTSLKNNVMDLAGYYNRRAAKFAAVTTPADFVHVLKSERYFEDTEANYLRGVNGWLNVLKTMSL